MHKSKLSSFRYNFQKGPVTEREIERPITEGNCRLAIQEYFTVFDGSFFSKNDLLNPHGYLHTGKFIKKGNGSHSFFDNLPTGAVIYAERIRNKDGETTDRSTDAFGTSEDYIISLHSAIFLKNLTRDIIAKLPSELELAISDTPAIWHATSIEGHSTIWTLEKFLTYYKPVAAKRFV